jgi:hypothetical protein
MPLQPNAGLQVPLMLLLLHLLLLRLLLHLLQQQAAVCCWQHRTACVACYCDQYQLLLGVPQTRRQQPLQHLQQVSLAVGAAVTRDTPQSVCLLLTQCCPQPLQQPLLLRLLHLIAVVGLVLCAAVAVLTVGQVPMLQEQLLHPVAGFYCRSAKTCSTLSATGAAHAARHQQAVLQLLQLLMLLLRCRRCVGCCCHCWAAALLRCPAAAAFAAGAAVSCYCC